MRSRVVRTAIEILFIATACMSVALAAQAQGPGCSYAGAAGKYADSFSGTFIGIGPFAGVEVLTADAAGNLSGKQTLSFNGEVQRATVTGTATVNPNCTGTASYSRFDEYNNLLSTGTLALVWDDNMQEVRFVFTSIVPPDGPPLPVVASGEGRKLSPDTGNQQ